MADISLLLTIQALLVWMIVFSAAAPIPPLPKKFAIPLIVITTVIAVVDFINYQGKWLIVFVCIAGYGWGSLVNSHLSNLTEKRKAKIFDAE
jgi:hypothetical protein